MSGHIRVLQKNIPIPGKHDHIDFITQKGVTIRYNDPRRFGIVTLAKREFIESHKLLKNIGPEPLSNNFNAVVLMKNLNGRNLNIKCALLDQKIVAGLGNIYVSESLFRSRISPKRLSKNIGIKITKIGKINSGSKKSLIIDQKDKQIVLKNKGYTHQF